jgi:hypothetical protein
MVSQQAEKPGPKRRATKVEVQSSGDWLKVREAAAEARVSAPVIYRFINEGLIESFLLKARPDSQSGVRLIRRSSLKALMDGQCKEQQTRPPLVRIPGRKREAAILRGLADRLEGVDQPF